MLGIDKIHHSAKDQKDEPISVFRLIRIIYI